MNNFLSQTLVLSELGSGRPFFRPSQPFFIDFKVLLLDNFISSVERSSQNKGSVKNDWSFFVALHISLRKQNDDAQQMESVLSKAWSELELDKKIGALEVYAYDIRQSVLGLTILNWYTVLTF